MRAGQAYHRINFYARVTTKDSYSAAKDSWPSVTIATRGIVRYKSGDYVLSNEEKFYSKSMELTVRYRSTIAETMLVQIDGGTDRYIIRYMEELGRKESLRLTLEKLNQ